MRTIERTTLELGRPRRPISVGSYFFCCAIAVDERTSAMNIAAACGVAAVCILGGGHYGRFMPYEVEQADGRPLPRAIIHQMSCFGCNWQCIYQRSHGFERRVSSGSLWMRSGKQFAKCSA